MYARVVAPSFITDMSKPRKRSDISSMVSLTSAAPAPDASYNAVRDASAGWAPGAPRPMPAPNWTTSTAAARPAPNPTMRDRVPWSILALESAPPMLVVRVDTPLPTRLNAPEATEPTFCIVALRPWKRLPSASRGWRTTRPSPPRALRVPEGMLRPIPDPTSWEARSAVEEALCKPRRSSSSKPWVSAVISTAASARVVTGGNLSRARVTSSGIPAHSQTATPRSVRQTLRHQRGEEGAATPPRILWYSRRQARGEPPRKGIHHAHQHRLRNLGHLHPRRPHPRSHPRRRPHQRRIRMARANRGDRRLREDGRGLPRRHQQRPPRRGDARRRAVLRPRLHQGLLLAGGVGHRRNHQLHRRPEDHRHPRPRPVTTRREGHPPRPSRHRHTKKPVR